MNLDRFIEAQAPVYADVVAELRAARKTSHWMWFVFPQLAALGRSATAKHYGLASRGEAAAYLAHPVLGPRLVECGTLVHTARHHTALAIFGSIDALKLRSSMTLFEAVPDADPIFGKVIDSHCNGERDPLTLALLNNPGG